MDAWARTELASIKAELRSIIYELESISNGVRNDFIGIGSERCAACLDKVISNYYRVQRKLNNMDTSTVTESFANAHGGGGGGGESW